MAQENEQMMAQQGMAPEGAPMPPDQSGAPSPEQLADAQAEEQMAQMQQIAGRTASTRGLCSVRGYHGVSQSVG